MKTLFRNASILKMDDTPIIFGDLLVIDNKIAYIGKDSDKYAPFDKVIECNGNILMPGFKNAHTHNAMVFLRSKADDDNLQDWLFNQCFPREALLKPGDIYALSKVALLEQISGGITSCLDMYFYVLEHKKAMEELGFRGVVQGCINAAYHTDDLVKLYKEINVEDSLVKFSIGHHAEYTVSEDELIATEKALREVKAPFQIHLSETKKEVEDCIKKRNMTPCEYFDSLKLWENGGVCFHCVYLTDHDIEIFKKKNIAVVTCPGSNLKLCSGIAPIKKYLDEGLLIGIGTDGPASNNSLDMFKEMTLVANLAKIQSGQSNALKAMDVLKMATVNGAKILGLDKCSTLEVGNYADIIEIDLSKPSMQPINDVVSSIVYAATKDVVKRTMINGKILYEDGKFFINEDIESIYEKAQEVTDRIDKEFFESK